MKYRDREELRKAVEKILKAPDKEVEQLPDMVRQEVKKIRAME